PVPVTSFHGFDGLADLMRIVEEVVVKPNTGQASLGHVAISKLAWCKCRFNRDSLELGLHCKIGTTRPQGLETRLTKQVENSRRVLFGNEFTHGYRFPFRHREEWNRKAGQARFRVFLTRMTEWTRGEARGERIERKRRVQ